MITLVVLILAAIFFIIGIELQWTWLISGKTPYDVIVDLGILTAGIAVFNGLLTIHQTWKVDRFKTRLNELMASPLPDSTKIRIAHSDTLTTFQGLLRGAKKNAADYLVHAGFVSARSDKIDLTASTTLSPIQFITIDELDKL